MLRMGPPFVGHRHTVQDAARSRGAVPPRGLSSAGETAGPRCAIGFRPCGPSPRPLRLDRDVQEASDAMSLDAGASASPALDDEARRRAHILARLQRQIDWYERVARQNNIRQQGVQDRVDRDGRARSRCWRPPGPMPSVVAGLGALVVVAQGFQEVFQFQANWVNFGRTKELLKRELALYQANAGPYTDTDDPSRAPGRTNGDTRRHRARHVDQSQRSEGKR